MLKSPTATDSSSSVARASPTSGMAACLKASNSATLMLMNRTPGSWNAVLDAVGKSVNRVPMPITRSASGAITFAASVPDTPAPPRLSGWS